MPKQKAIGTPAARQAATNTTRNRRILALPNFTREGEKNQSAPAIAMIRRAATARSRHDELFSAYATTMPSIATMPKGMAATRKVFGMFRAGDVMYHSSSA